MPNTTDQPSGSHSTARNYNWPEWLERTPPEERGSYPGDLSLTRKQSFEAIITQFEKWGAVEVDVESASDHRMDKPHLPYQRSTPDDPSVVVHFRMAGDDADQMRHVGCDAFESQRECARALVTVTFPREDNDLEEVGFSSVSFVLTEEISTTELLATKECLTSGVQSLADRVEVADATADAVAQPVGIGKVIPASALGGGDGDGDGDNSGSGVGFQ